MKQPSSGRSLNFNFMQGRGPPKTPALVSQIDVVARHPQVSVDA